MIEKAKDRKTKKIQLFGENVLCRLHSVKEMESFQSMEDKKLNEFIAEQFLDPEDGKPIFTPDFLVNELPGADLQTMLELFLKHNGANIPVESIEKN